MKTDFLEVTSFLNSANSAFVSELYSRYLSGSKDIDEEWANFFEELQDNAPDLIKELEGPSWAPRLPKIINPGSMQVGETVGRALPEAPRILAQTTQNN